jgi:transcriptional/translational regulatory protein YebC/TACO1
VIIEASDLDNFSKKVGEIGLKIIRSELVYRVKTLMNLSNEDELNKILDFIDELESNDDVLGVYAGFDYN